IFRHLLTDLRKFRLEAKAKMRAAKNQAEQRQLEAFQNTFKILINSFYGYLGFGQGHFADFDAAARVTQIGRDLLKKMIDWLNKHGAKVIEVDTDGIYFVPPDKIDIDELQKGLAKELPPGIEVEFDEQFKAMFSYKAKNYALLTKNDQVSYYIKSTPKKVAAYEAARLASDFDPQNRDENVDYYVAKLDELVKKFSGLTATASAPKQETLAL